MTATNSLPVRHRLIEIAADHGPYRCGMTWADPDLAHAAELMRWAYGNRDAACAVGARARDDIAALYAPAVVGALVRERLTRIACRVR